MPTPKKPRRGRPREYDADKALASAADCFWQHGYAGTSLDALAVATGMNRPSLYAAFGDKHNLYLKTLRRYRDESRTKAQALLVDQPPLRIYLERFYGAALDVYYGGSEGARGCYSIGTAATESKVDPAVRTKDLSILFEWIIEKFPGGASASVAVRRLATLHSELKSSQNTATKTLGAYEKDLGLKQPDVK